MERRPGRAAWIAWACAFVGGLGVLLGAAIVLVDPCSPSGAGLRAIGCAGSTLASAVPWLVSGGTCVATAGGVAGTAITVRRIAGAQPIL